MPFSPLPRRAAWLHRDARSGFEVAFLHSSASGYHVEGHTAAVENGEVWAVQYAIDLDSSWVTRRARVSGISDGRRRELTLEAVEMGRWRINGAAAPHLDGCLDVDLESSALTNTFPVHRLGLTIGQGANAPAVYVRALDLSVERLEQHYTRVEDDGRHQRFDYQAPAFDFECRLVYDEFGLVLDYPGIAVRAT